jgi:hypothetical protein
VSPADDVPARRLRAVPLALLTLAALTGCAGDEPAATPSTTASAAPAASATGPAQESIVTTTKPTCSVVEHDGQRLGVTVPAGFMVTSTPRGAGDFAQSGVNIVSVAQWRDTTDRGPGVVLVVYAYGEGEARGATALESSVRNFKALVGARNATAPVTAKPATVAGRPGSAGGETDPVAMDFQWPDGKPSPLHWWTVPTPKGEFVLAFGARDTALDTRYAPQIRSGLKADGC